MGCVYLSSLDEFVDEMHCVVAVVRLPHDLSHTLRADSVIWREKRQQHKTFLTEMINSPTTTLLIEIHARTDSK